MTYWTPELRALAEHLAELHGASWSEVSGRGRCYRVAHARHAVWAALRVLDTPRLSLPNIAELFGVDHSTVLSGIRAHHHRSRAHFRAAKCEARGEISRCA